MSDNFNNALDVLQVPITRKVVLRAKQANDPTIENIAKSTGLDNAIVLKNVNIAEKIGLLSKKHNIVCHSCGSALARVDKRDDVTKMAQNNVSCPNCRARVKGDSYTDCYIVPKLMAELLNGSRWMELIVWKVLKEYVPEKNIQTSIIDGPNELDVIANANGELILMELKDSQFSIGHAYSFVGKCSQYKPDISVVVSTEGIDQEVKEYISNTGVDTHYVESIQQLPIILDQIFTQKNARHLGGMFAKIDWSSKIIHNMMSALGLSVNIPNRIRSPRSRFREFEEMEII